MPAGIVIVGAGQAGLQIAEALRAEQYDGAITLIGGESHPPYQRPPLSKAVLLGKMDPARLTLRSPEAIARKDIAFMSGASVTAIDRAHQTVHLADGQVLPYAGLAFATGGRARSLPIPGRDLVGVLALRGIEDAVAIGSALAGAETVVVVGGGFIGLEVAAVARMLGKRVTVLEAAPRLMARAVSPLLSEVFAELHQGRGVDIELGAVVSEIVGDDGRARGVRLADGRTFAADLVLLSAGLVPNTELAVAAGLDGAHGIVVDQCARTGDARIVAAGDCAARRLPDGTLLRLESVQCAVEQGKAAAASLVGRERPFTASPWFWSDQYDIKLQMAGQSGGHDHVEVRGDRADFRFSAFYFRGETLIGVDSLNRAQDHMIARRLIDRGRSPTVAQVRDDAFPLQSLVSQPAMSEAG
jgi:3-phenylpropionate/trans-cinnamate dioxygenase ferredoxin reductase subunit